MTLQYRQGDVLLIKVDAVPQAAQPKPLDNGKVVLAYGEQTGHSHSIASRHASAYSVGDVMYIDTKYGATLSHEEHFPIKIEPGAYKVVIQRQYVGEPATRPEPDWYEYMD